jgi:hypothetical protein
VLINDNGYFKILKDIKERIRNAQYQAILGVNREQIILFWNIGKVISENVKYGSSFIDNLSRDINSDFPNIKGYSSRNLRYMRKFADFVHDEEILQTVSAIFKLVRTTHTYLDKTKTEQRLIEFGRVTM